MAEAELHRLRTTFDEVAEQYERARPTYPEALLIDLAGLAGLSRGAHLLEIGCGTGQATRPLAERGFRVTCVELGERLAAAARRNLRSFPAVEVVNAPFETWDPGPVRFDAVLAFTSFHWIDPELRYAKSARLLRAGGALAVVATNHVLADGGDTFFVDVQEDYDAIVPSDDNRPPGQPAAVPDRSEEIEASGLFGEIRVRRYLSDVTYTSDSYIAVLGTYSGHRALAPEVRRRLYARIRARPEGTVRKTYLFTLTVARRLEP